MNEVEQAFITYITEFSKSYGSMEEYGFRLSQFARNHKLIHDHNESDMTFKLAHNHMSDWTEEEYD